MKYKFVGVLNRTERTNAEHKPETLSVCDIHITHTPMVTSDIFRYHYKRVTEHFADSLQKVFYEFFPHFLWSKGQ